MMRISNAQVLQFNEKLNEELIDYLEKFLKHQYPQACASLGDPELHARCVLFVQQCIQLGATDNVSLLRLGEIVFGVEPTLDLTRLGPTFRDALGDRRFSFEERVDVVTLRLAFLPTQQ